MDYRALLGARDEVVLPYFGGTWMDAPTRRLRAPAELAPGWWRCRIEGRRAVAIEPAAATDLGALPALRGHWADGWIIANGRELGRIGLPPADEPPPLARVTARRWYSGDLILESIDFEDDAELAARAALEQLAPLGELRGVAPSLCAAFGYALGLAVARAERIAVALRELTPHVVAIADGGAPIVRALLADQVARRERARAELAEATRVHTSVSTARARTRAADPVRRADDALDAAGARMLGCLRVDNGAQLDVTFEVDGERILALVAADSLQVLDPGVCLSGAHRVLTLDALPSVIREAIADDALNITRFR